MEAALVTAAITSAVGELRQDMEGQNKVLKDALDKEFGTVRKEAADALQKVEDAFTAADQQVRSDYQAQQLRIGKVEVAANDHELRLKELNEKLQKYEALQQGAAAKKDTELNDFKTQMVKDFNDLRVSMSTYIGAAPAQGPPGIQTGYSPKTLDQDKRMEVKQISGHEPVHELLEWFERVLTNIESCIPNSRSVLTEAMEFQQTITFEHVEAVQLKAVAHRLNSELHSWLYNVCTLRAWTFLRSIPSGHGLEAFRYVYRMTTRRTPQ